MPKNEVGTLKAEELRGGAIHRMDEPEILQGKVELGTEPDTSIDSPSVLSLRRGH